MNEKGWKNQNPLAFHLPQKMNLWLLQQLEVMSRLDMDNMSQCIYQEVKKRFDYFFLFYSSRLAAALDTPDRSNS